MKLKSFSVTQVTNYLKRIISYDPILSNITVEGEISNFKRHTSGHGYFSIKDEDSKLNCVIFRLNLEKVTFPILDGMHVSIKGSVGIYERDGKYQLYAEKINLLGEGPLKEKYDALKYKLENEGMFDQIHKKEIPKFSSKIAVITSPTGAAIRDILSVVKRRNDSIEIVILPVRVQGEYAKDEISYALKKVNQIGGFDVIILSRGGGSIEELWAFNEEVVAREVFNSKIPVISGVGHETDFTICDYVSDLRAATPSSAAEIAVFSKKQLDIEISNNYNFIIKSIKSRIDYSQIELERYSPANYKSILYNGIKSYILSIDNEMNKASKFINMNIGEKKIELDYIFNNLNNLNPLNMVNRGYAVVEDTEGNLVTSANNIKVDDIITVKFSNSKIKAKIMERDEVNGVREI